MFIRLLRRSIQKLAVNHCDYCRLVMPPSETIWCQPCLDMIATISRCVQCGLAVKQGEQLCAACVASPPLWDRLFCVSDYAEPLREYIGRFKYNQHFWLAQDFAFLLSQRILDPAPLILPVPMHWQRFVWRSFNQSDHLGWALAKQLNADGAATRCDSRILKRIKATKPQQGLSRTRRKTNLLGAFAVTKPITEKHVAIVDDVLTTGSTINLLCVELRKAGVEQIDVYVICRTSLTE